VIHQSDRETWLAARNELITASDVASLLGENYAKNDAERVQQRSRIIMQKAGLAEGWEGNETTELASELEESVIAIARKRFGIDIRATGVLQRDDVEPRLGATTDSVWQIESLLLEEGAWFCPVNVKVSSCAPPEECKSRKDGTPSQAAFANGVPLYYQLQLQAEMAVTGAHHGCLLVLHHDQANLRLRMYSVPRHDGVIARIRSEVAKAWVEIEALRAGKLAAE
jgi:predicted phage-related endonuclease